MKINTLVQKNLANILGWKTKRKIVVFESDDWGSIRMSSSHAYNTLRGAEFDLDYYNKYDSLESNDDMYQLYSVLSNHKNINGVNPIFTAVTIVANPDFERIKNSGFRRYYYEPFTTTLKRYPNHNDVYQLYLKGIERKLFYPVFHGREHLNVQRWMSSLRDGDKSVRLAFDQGVTGVDKGIKGRQLPDFQAAFSLDSVSDLDYMKQVLSEGLDLFEDLFGYKSTYFVPTNGPFNNSLEETLSDKGVLYINTAKRQKEPLGDNRFQTNYRYLGQVNRHRQCYLTRNCFFEPANEKLKSASSWVNDCLKEIEIAFKWKSPAIISSHRVNYVGFLHKANREKNLDLLNSLIGKIISRWPEVEFMTSVDLGNLISRKDGN